MASCRRAAACSPGARPRGAAEAVAEERARVRRAGAAGVLDERDVSRLTGSRSWRSASRRAPRTSGTTSSTSRPTGATRRSATGRSPPARPDGVRRRRRRAVRRRPRPRRRHRAWQMGLAVVAYIVLTIAYTLDLKHVAVVDVVAVSRRLRRACRRGRRGRRRADVELVRDLHHLRLAVRRRGKRYAERRELGDDAGDRGHPRGVLDGYLRMLLARRLAVARSATAMWAFETAPASARVSRSTSCRSCPMLMALLRYPLVLEEGGGRTRGGVRRDRPLQVLGLLVVACVSASMSPERRSAPDDPTARSTGWGRTAPSAATSSSGRAGDVAVAARARRPRLAGRARPRARSQLRRRRPERRRHGAAPGAGPIHLDREPARSALGAGASLDELLRASRARAAGSCRSPPGPDSSPWAAPSPPTSTARTITSTARSARTWR